MKAFDNGSLFTVTVSRNEVIDFACHWPCFGAAPAMSFQFDKRTGDLVDLHGDQNSDGHGVSALADDAKRYGAKRLGLDL